MASSFDRRSQAVRTSHPSREYVSVGDAWHRGYWAGRFGISEEELLRAIAAVGSSVQAIQHRLHSQPARTRHN